VKAAVQWQALAAIFDGRCDLVTTSTVLSAKVSITPNILTLYEQNLGADPKFQTWFASASQGRFSIHLPSLSPGKVRAIDPISDGYGTAAYFGCSSFFAHLPDVSAEATQGLESIGTRVISVRRRIDFPIEGDNPVFTIGTETDGTLDFDCLNRFLLPEDNIVVYDKFINTKSIQLLEHIAKTLTPGSILRIFHTYMQGRNLLSSADIFARLIGANSHITIECKTVSNEFKKLEHDRYIFLGSRLQLVFSAGLDCFGDEDLATGKRKNKRSKISFYDVTLGEDLRIDADDGTHLLVKSIGGM
jgi:hypothetical protein